MSQKYFTSWLRRLVYLIRTKPQPDMGDLDSWESVAGSSPELVRMSSKSMNAIPNVSTYSSSFDAWKKVAKCVPVHPQTFTRLAQVNKVFYNIFMSDELWHKLDFYNVKENIATYFLLESKRFGSGQRKAITSCCEVANIRRCRLHPGPALKRYCRSTNLYVSFLVLANNYQHCLDLGVRFDQDFPRAPIANLLKSDLGYLGYCSDEERGDYFMVHRAVLMRPDSLKYASVRLRDDPDIVYAAMQNDPSMYRLAGPKARQSPKVFGAYMAHLRSTDTVKSNTIKISCEAAVLIMCALWIFIAWIIHTLLKAL